MRKELGFHQNLYWAARRIVPVSLGVWFLRSLEGFYRALPTQNYHPDFPHYRIISAATYSPWSSDDEFASAYRRVIDHTLLDELRCYQLWSLARQAACLPGSAIEIGSWRGGSGCLIASQLRDRPVYLCDTFSGVVKAGEMDTAYRGGEHADTTKQTVEDLASRLGLPNVRILQGIFPDDTAAAIASERFAFCHIDVDTYQSAHDIFESVWPLMLQGGVVVFDDYGFAGCTGVTRLVNELSTADDRRFVYNITGQAIFVKVLDG